MPLKPNLQQRVFESILGIFDLLHRQTENAQVFKDIIENYISIKFQQPKAYNFLLQQLSRASNKIDEGIMEIMSAIGERSTNAESSPSKLNPDRERQKMSGSTTSTDVGTLVFSTVKHLPLILRMIKISFDQNISFNIKGEEYKS